MHGHQVHPHASTAPPLPGTAPASRIDALRLFNEVAPALCSCGELMTDPFEIRNGLCWICQAAAAGCTNKPTQALAS